MSTAIGPSTTGPQSDYAFRLPPVGKYSSELARAHLQSRPPTVGMPTPIPIGGNLKERLFDSRAACKIAAAQIAMHLNREWRNKLFVQIDSLLDDDEWDPADKPASRESFVTFLRMILFTKSERRPGLGATAEGDLIAMWTNKVEGSDHEDRLTVYCLPNDVVRWSVSHWLGPQLETAAGQTRTERLIDVLGPYGGQRWFRLDDKHQR